MSSENKAVCSKCKKTTFVNPTALAARIAKFGTVEKMNEEWICRACLNEGKPKKEKKEKVAKIKPLLKPSSKPERKNAEEESVQIEEDLIPEKLDSK